MKTFLKDLVSNQTLLVTAFFSATTLLLSLMQFFRDILNGQRQNQLEKTKLNYSYKLNCYSELIAMFSEKSSFVYSDKNATFQFKLLLSKSRLLCTDKTKQKITKVLDLYSRCNNEDFFKAFQDLMLAMEDELNTDNETPKKAWGILILILFISIISNLDRILSALFK